MGTEYRANRLLVCAAYLVCAYLCVVPLAEAALSVWPVHPGTTTWRVGAVGLMAKSLMTPLFGFAGIVGIAVVFSHGRTLRILSLVAALASAITLLAIPVFALDALELRGRIEAGARTAFDVSTLVALAKMGVTVLIGVLLAFGAWWHARAVRVHGTPVERQGVALVFRRRVRSSAQPEALPEGAVLQ